MSARVLVTGSCGLIGSAVVRYFGENGFHVTGVDDNHRAVFFGPDGDTSWMRLHLSEAVPTYIHYSIDVRDRVAVQAIINTVRPELIVHAAAQPSHDRAASILFLDFEVNAVGTLNLLEAVREFCPEAPFVFMSTNKVYGDRPNTIALIEEQTRWVYADPAFKNGIAEDFPIDQSKHSLFGASKLSADILVQEFGRYFGMATCCLRGGCLTGPDHSGVRLHGFLSYLIKCNRDDTEYTVFGYKGKQVRDNLHAYDVATFIHEFFKKPKCAAVYNLGGGRGNSCSILEAFAKVEAITGRPMRWSYVEEPRSGDHICYYSDLRRLAKDYPGWRISKPLDTIVEEIAKGWDRRLSVDCGSRKIPAKTGTGT